LPAATKLATPPMAKTNEPTRTTVRVPVFPPDRWGGAVLTAPDPGGGAGD